MTNTIYGSIITTKTESLIPQLLNGKTLESKYNPEREAETIFSQLDKTYKFYVIAGVGSGILLNYISKVNPEAQIIGIEGTSGDIDFLKSIPTFNSCMENPKISICTIDELEKLLINTYIPAIYGDIKIIFQKVWATEKPDYYERTRQIIQNSIVKISADYSTQAHFGKIWQRNIISNLKLLNAIQKNNVLNIDKSKTAAIIAAGPSLDQTVTDLIQNRNDYFIISTDTAYRTLLKHNIHPEIVVSIDGQHISSNHFITKPDSNTNFVFDLCSNSSITKKLNNYTDKIFFFTNGHPLSNLAASVTDNNIPYINTGSGTVTIASLDIAIKSGFNDIKIFGADFGYVNNKPYAKGTYLDSLYNLSSSHLQSIDKNYNKLMYRTKLLKLNEKKYTTEVLTLYKESLENYLIQQNIPFILKNDTYSISFNNNSAMNLSCAKIDFTKFYDALNSNKKICLLPYIAWLRNQISHKSDDFETLLNLAFKDIVRYN